MKEKTYVYRKCVCGYRSSKPAPRKIFKQLCPKCGKQVEDIISKHRPKIIKKEKSPLENTIPFGICRKCKKSDVIKGDNLCYSCYHLVWETNCKHDEVKLTFRDKGVKGVKCRKCGCDLLLIQEDG